jgi:hypothetical protein
VIEAERARYRLFAKRWGVKRVKREVVCPCPLWFKDNPVTRYQHKHSQDPHRDWYCKLAATGFFDHASLWGLQRKVPPGRGRGPVLFVSQPYHEPSNNGEEGRLWKTCRDMGCTVQFWDPLFSPYYPGRTHLVMVWGPRVTPRPMALMGEVGSPADVWGARNVLE